MYNPNDPANERDPYDPRNPGDYQPPPAGERAREPMPNDPYADWNNGSPPDAPLKPGHGWEWNGSRWIQVQGRGLGYNAPQTSNPPQSNPQGQPQPQGGGQGGGQVAGVPASFGQAASSTLSGSVPTLRDAITGAKDLPSAPQIQPYQQFQAPQQVGQTQRNSILEAILNKPQVLGQQTQDQMFEQQKELQTSLASQARERAAQTGAQRGLSGQGGYAAASNAQVESDFGRNLMQGQRDIQVQAAQLNRQSELAALEMQDAIAQGDYNRAAQAYQLQLQAQAMTDEMKFKMAEYDRANVALAAQTGMAGRQQQLAEQNSSFQQYLAQKEYEEMMRQFNESMGLNWSQFGWDQQFNTASLFNRPS